MSFSRCRQIRQLLTDPVLRGWLFGRLRQRWPATHEPFPPHRPPELTDAVVAALAADSLVAPPTRSPAGPAQGRLLLRLPGRTVDLDHPNSLFSQELPDHRDEAGRHAFAWLGHAGPDGAPVDSAWGAALWSAWAERHRRPDVDDIPAWAPPVVAARIIAWLDHSRRHGWQPGLAVALAEQGRFLAEHLDYWGETATTADLAGEALALARLGLSLGLAATAEFGLALLLGEGERRLAPCGLLRQGSSLEQLRFARFVAEAWLAARQAGRPESLALSALLRRLLAVLDLLTLPGGLPQIGQDGGLEPPDQSFGLLPRAAAGGWLARLPAEEAQALLSLRDASRQPDQEILRPEGWLRLDHAGWSGLWHASPQGWLERRAHQDLGSAELHYQGRPVFIDPGDGPLGAVTVTASAALHSGLQIDEAGPYPDDHPVYSAAFHRAIAGKPPQLRAEADGVSLRFESYQRLGGPREVIRQWHFAAGGGLEIADFVNGTGRFPLSRRLITPLAASLDEEGGVLLADGTAARWRIRGDGPAPRLTEGQRHRPEGGWDRVWIIEFTEPRANLPYRRRLTVEPL